MNKTYFISDPHFGHANIIKYENRPFHSVAEMDKVLINNWNGKIKKEYDIYILGDFAFYPKAKIAEICAALNGRKHLILGNHDTKSETYYRECGFLSAYRHPIIFNEFFILSHKPLYLEKNSVFINIHGHTHSNFKQDAQHINVCVENFNYTPIEFNQLCNIIKQGQRAPKKKSGR